MTDNVFLLLKLYPVDVYYVSYPIEILSLLVFVRVKTHGSIRVCGEKVRINTHMQSS